MSGRRLMGNLVCTQDNLYVYMYVSWCIHYLLLASPTSRLPLVEIEVPAYELPLPEGVGHEQLHGENLSMREIEETWKEKLIESHTSADHTQQ